MIDMLQAQCKLLQTMNQAWPCLPQAKAILNPVNQAQPLMYSFILLNIARLFTKPKVKLLHDLCTSSTLFICICESFLFGGINDSGIHLPDFTVIRCDRISREGGGWSLYLPEKQYFV